MSVHDIQMGIVAETTYGTFVPPTRSYPISTMPSIKKEYGRNVNPAWYAGVNTETTTDFTPDTKQPATGGLGTVPVQTRGMSMLLKHIFGEAPTIGAAVSTIYPHVFVPGAHTISFSSQVNRPFAQGSGGKVASYAGCKVTDAKFACKVSNGPDGILTVEPNIVAQSEVFTEALAAASYGSSTSQESLSFAAVTVTIDGTEFCADSFELSIANNFRSFDATRKFCGGGTISEPVQEKGADIMISLTGADFTSGSDALYTKLRSATASGTLCAIVATFTGIADATQKIVFSAPNARIDGAVPTGSGTSKYIDHPVNFKCLATSGGTAALTTTYYSKDSAI